MITEVYKTIKDVEPAFLKLINPLKNVYFSKKLLLGFEISNPNIEMKYICVYDNGTTDDCVNNHPSIISNTYYDNGTISGTSNSPLDNDTRFFEENMRIGLGTMRLSAGFGANLRSLLDKENFKIYDNRITI